MKELVNAAYDVAVVISIIIAWVAAVLVCMVFIILFYAAAVTAIVGPVAFIIWLFGHAIGAW